MVKIIIFILTSVWLYSYGIICNTEEGRVWRENKLYRGEDYYKLKRTEEERIKTIVEDFAIALLAKDVERLSELSYYKGSQLEKRDKISALITSYHNHRGLVCHNIEVVSVKTDKNIENGKAVVRIHYSSLEALGGLGTAPIIDTWNFIYKDGD
ncbi:MAG: hypothetical protein DRP68_05935 [Candidatus Omnitrophota bacterium]|nr:MAG: hypothetical protein DRP68_05935 [Candidatus Omnitrophota bacterium]